ncbi:14944_t:CDS:1, partial [Acaulospora morrowiae]
MINSSNKRNLTDPDSELDVPKKQKIKSSFQHPLGIKPWGNYYVDSIINNNFQISCRESSLGTLARLTDDLILEILGLLSVRDLLAISATSKVCYCFATFDELWKQLVIRKYNGDWWWQGTWRLTFLK